MNLDTNIDHYDNTELENLFRLEPGYTVTQIVNAERTLHDKLMRSVGDFATQQNLALFLGQAMQRLSEAQLPTPPPKPEVEEKWTRYMFTVDSTQRAPGSKLNDFVCVLHEPIRVHSLQMEFFGHSGRLEGVSTVLVSSKRHGGPSTGWNVYGNGNGKTASYDCRYHLESAFELRVVVVRTVHG